MDKIETAVLRALKEQNPGLLKEMQDSGKLKAFLRDQADEINDQISTLGAELATKHGAFRKPEPPFQEKVGILNTADQMATEIVLKEMLNYPQES